MADNTSPQELRESYDKLKAEHEKLQKENGGLRSENRTLKAQGFGLTAPQAQAFVSATPDGDITAEVVKTFATNLGITIIDPAAPKQGPGPVAPVQGTPTTPGVGDGAPSTVNSGLALVGRGGTPAGAGGQPPATLDRLTTAQLGELKKTDPLAAVKALREGRVIFSKDNFYVKEGLIRQE